MSDGLFDGVLTRGEVRAAVSDEAWLRALLDAESALVTAQARLGLVPASAASAVVAACADVRAFDLATLGRAAAASGNPVLPLVKALRTAVPPGAAEYVHRGATSQDILDTAAMLVTHRALEPLLDDLDAAADAAASLASEYRDTPAAGRTLLRLAAPTTFGLKAAGWLAALDTAADRLNAIRHKALAVQLGGAVGTLAALLHANGSGDRSAAAPTAPAAPTTPGPAPAAPTTQHGPFELVEAVADELGLRAPLLPWHTDRTRIAEVAGALGLAAGVCAKVARDVTLLAQDEVGEVEESAPGASSAMPHKRNAVAAVSALACAAQAPGLVATLLASMVHEHERAAGAWHAEWRPLRELLAATGSAASWLRECLTGLRVDPDALRRNLDALLRASNEKTIDVGAAPELVDRALAAHDGHKPTSGSPPR
jgi:3-carboxy-cis,cis-muconate cycloisomerase